MVAVLIVPLRSPLNVVAVTVPELEILLAPISIFPVIAPPISASFLASNSAIALSTSVATIAPVVVDTTSAAV